MQLNEILEKNSLKTISQKTSISEKYLDALFSGDFNTLNRVKTFGFISIIEREFNADLAPLKKEALAFYDNHKEATGIVLDIPVVEQKKGKSGLFILIVLVLLGIASWYFITQFDQEKLRGILPFNEEKLANTVQGKKAKNSDLSIEHVVTKVQVEENKSN